MSDLHNLALHWLERFDRDSCRVVYEALYRAYRRNRIVTAMSSWQHVRMLDVGAGYGNTILAFRDLRRWEFTAIEPFSDVAEKLGERLESERVPCDVFVGTVKDYIETQQFVEPFDIAVMSLTTQYVSPDELQDTLTELAGLSRRLLIDVTNPNSLYARWTQFRGWRSSDAHYYSPREIESILSAAGFDVTRRVGVGLISPLSLLSDFRAKFIPAWLSRLTRPLDRLAVEHCHLYALACVSRRGI